MNDYYNTVPHCLQIKFHDERHQCVIVKHIIAINAHKCITLQVDFDLCNVIV